MPITALPALDRTSATFRADVDTFFSTQIPTFVTEANALETNVNAKEASAVASAATATTQAGLATTNGAAQVALAAGQVTLAAGQVTLAAGQVTLATTQANLSANYANVAASSVNFIGNWASLTGAVVALKTVYHSGGYWILLNNVADVSINEPGVSAAWSAIGFKIDFIAYDSRANLRTLSAKNGDAILVESLGLFRFYSSTSEPDDDETAFINGSGGWLVECPHWDLLDAMQLPDESAQDDRAEDAETRLTSSETRLTSSETRWPGRILHGTAVSAITSLAAVTRTSITGTITGAVTGDRVMATPPDALDTAGRVFWTALVTAANTVTIYLNNPSASAATLVAGTWKISVIQEL